MIPYLRQIKIIQLLDKKNVVSIGDIQKELLGISVSTIRRDIKFLVEAGKAVELQGGALKLKDMSYDTPVVIKETLHSKEKQRIARHASNLIHSGETIYIDSGTTLTHMFPYILDKKITLVSTNTDIYKYFRSESHAVSLIQIGGEFSYNLRSLAGPLTNFQLEMLHFDKAFLGASGFDTKAGITTPDFHEMAKKKIILNNSKETYFLIDSSKHEQVFVSQICSLEKAYVISDKMSDALSHCLKYYLAD